MARSLITGASGFIGRPLVEQLARAGGEVHAVHVRAQPPQIADVHWHRLDLADAESVDNLMREVAPERLIHLAWYVEHGRFWDAAENTVWVERSLDLLRAFSAAGGRRAVMLGTCAEYDWHDPVNPLHELGSPLAPATLYGTAKDALRRASTAFAEREGLGFAWGRVFFPYGPGESKERLVPSVTRAVLAGEPISTTSGEQVRDFIHVEDVAGAVAAIVDSSVNGPVNIGSGEGVQVRELVDTVARAAGDPQLVRRGELPQRDGDPAALVADVGRLRGEVGFTSRHSLSEGLAQTVNWWRLQASSS
ncbi:MAG: NAD-dependent epimerase/dehydratase [Solirubrobacterales bacterium]|nr:NAD-dependent epimerase/dehydratase [Solirubrobacterales bacterium]